MIPHSKNAPALFTSFTSMNWNSPTVARGPNFKPQPPEPRTDSYYKKRPCPEMVYCAADILETYLAGEAETPTA